MRKIKDLAAWHRPCMLYQAVIKIKQGQIAHFPPLFDKLADAHRKASIKAFEAFHLAGPCFLPSNLSISKGFDILSKKW